MRIISRRSPFLFSVEGNVDFVKWGLLVADNTRLQSNLSYY